jgi:hypothetical protein
MTFPMKQTLSEPILGAGMDTLPHMPYGIGSFARVTLLEGRDDPGFFRIKRKNTFGN